MSQPTGPAGTLHRFGALALPALLALALVACGGATAHSSAATTTTTAAAPAEATSATAAQSIRADHPAPTAAPTASPTASPSPTPAPTPTTVAGLFEGDFTVKVGTTVTYTNTDDAEPHTVSARNGAWDTGIIFPGQSVSITYSTPGKYAYYCMIHPNMIGTLTVTK